MPRRRPNPKKKSARKREVDEWLATGRGQALLATLELQESCPELTTDALRRRQHFDESTNSCRFDLSGCSMTALPASISSWKSSPKPLIELNLCRCTRLTALPDEICELTTLKLLGLKNCSSLAALPDAIGELIALEELHLSECSSLAALPNSIGELKTLNFLNLTKCVRLIFLPFTLGDLKELETLVLDDCTNLSALPGTINGLEALQHLMLAGCSSLVLSRDALNGLGALEVLRISRCDKIGELRLTGLTNLKGIDITNSVNIGFGVSTVLMLHKQKVELAGSDFSIRKGVRELRKRAKRRRRRRLCDYCGRQGGIDEPRLPVCYCGERRYCDATCQQADWGAGHSKTCRLGSLSAAHVVILQSLEEYRSLHKFTDAEYRGYRDRYLSMTPAYAQGMLQDGQQQGIF